MELKKSVVFTRLLIVNLLFLTSAIASACVVMESPETYRMMLFQARTGNSSSLQIFNYTPDLYAGYKPDPDGTDRIRNAKEWQTAVGTDVLLEDILSIQYDTKTDSLIAAYTQNRIKLAFDDNTLIQVLSKTTNKTLLEYLIFSKQVEATESAFMNTFESWNRDPDEINSALKAKQALFLVAKKRLSTSKSEFLKKRYAYQLCRLGYQLKNYSIAISTYESRFKKFNGTDLMNVWSALFYAQSLDASKKSVKANYFYSLIFDNCDSKKLRCHQCFHTDEATFTAGLKLAKTSHEKAVMWVMRTINYPGPCLNQLKTITQLEPKSDYLPFLIAREMNKLEDWICTPVFSLYTPSLSPQWNMSLAKNVNQQHDQAYLQDFKSFLQKLRGQERGEMHQYLTLCLAHISILGDNTKDGLDYLNTMGLSENSSMELQKNIEKAWILAKTTDVTNDNFKDQFVIYCRRLQRLAKSDNTINKMLYTLLRCVAHEYETRNDFATAGLLSMKSDVFMQQYDTTSRYTTLLKNSYDKLRYFDINAGISDMDNLIRLIMKRDKSEFEDFVCDQHLGSVDFYRDLQGTIAFRNNDLNKAAQIFRMIHPDFWKTNYEYAKNLNEDPFIPKALTKVRNFHYRFDKNRFVKQLIGLQEKSKKKTGNAEACLQLGNAYFNCSYWGNSWMMVKYGWSAADNFIIMQPADTLGYITQEQPSGGKTALLAHNYYNCKLAAQYYTQALNDPKATTEQKAYACLMLHECNYLPWSFTNIPYAEPQLKYTAGDALKELYSKYNNTKVYKDYKCPLLDSFIHL